MAAVPYMMPLRMQSTVFLPMTRPGLSSRMPGSWAAREVRASSGDAHARDDAAAQVGAAPVHHLDGGGGAQVHQDQGRLVLCQGGHGDDDAVAAHLGWGRPCWMFSPVLMPGPTTMGVLPVILTSPV